MPSFAVERTLGRLAKWLRIMGFDTVCEADETRTDYPGVSGSNRVHLTRTVRVAKSLQVEPLLMIRSDLLREQLHEVVTALDIKFSDVRLFSRCLKCNRPIQRIAKSRVRSLVPDYVWDHHENFSRCPKCLKIYWSGTHSGRSMQFIRQVIEEARGTGNPATRTGNI